MIEQGKGNITPTGVVIWIKPYGTTEVKKFTSWNDAITFENSLKKG
tara:strand:+ start:444 stop:581 length:138 start_codon:yes stop_codon:yes gene_type:complete